MTQGTVKSLIDLPDDVLLEIFSYLSASSIILSCRQVCQKMNCLSRERHLWIRVFNKTKHMLRPVIDLDQEKWSELERIMARAEILERKWSDKDGLWVAPRYWRSATRALGSRHGEPVAIMEEYVVFKGSIWNSRQTSYTWANIHSLDGPAVFTHVVSPLLESATHYMDSTGGTFFVVSAPLSETSLKVMGIQIVTGVPHVTVEYSVPLRNHIEIDLLDANNGLVCVYHCLHPDNPHLVDVLDLQTRTLSYFNPTRPRSILPPHESSAMRTLYNVATKTHLMQTYSKNFFAVFVRSDQGAQPAGSTSPIEPILRGRFPASWCGLRLLPRSAASFVVVGVEQIGRHRLQEACLIRIRLLSVGLADPLKEVCSLEVPGTFGSFILPTPPSLAQYALGVLSVTQRAPDSSDAEEGCKYYGVRVDLPDLSERDPGAKRRDYITLNRMYLSPALDEKNEEARFCYFDPFLGKSLLSVKSGSSLQSVLVLEHLRSGNGEAQM